MEFDQLSACLFRRALKLGNQVRHRFSRLIAYGADGNPSRLVGCTAHCSF
jgi:hypothetical protein